MDDHFDDGAIGTNTKGTGTGFNTAGLTGGSVTESDSFAHLINTTNGAARAAIASKEGASLASGISRFEFRGVSFARNAGNTGTGSTGRTALGVRGNSTAEDTDTAVANGFWIQFESGDIGETNLSWSGTSTLFYESSTSVKTVLATWKFDTLNWDDNNAGTMDFTPVLDITLDLTPAGYSLIIKGDSISEVTGSLSGSYASAGITNELTAGYAFAFNQGEAPGLDVSIDRIIILENAPAPVLASLPNPGDGAKDVLRNVILSWSPGPFAETHDVYFGTSFDDVTNADRSAPGTVLLAKGQDPNMFNVGALEFGKTYYWRVDEVNAPSAGGTVYKGDVWSFTIEPASVEITDVNATADSSYDTSSVAGKTVDGSGLDPNTGTHGTAAGDMWISGMTAFPHWIQFSFDKLYKLDQMTVWNSNQMMEGLFGLGAKSVLVQVSTDGTSWTDVGNFVFTKAPGNTSCAADTKVPFGGVAAKSVKLTITSNWGGFFTQGSLSEVRFYAIPVAAREPSPAPGSANLHPQVAMKWRAGRDAVSHEVHIGTDANEVAASTTPTATVTAAKYDAALGLGQTYYWKVVEVNQTTDPTSWASDVWSFSTAAFINIDDFESYTNNSPKRVFQTWIDGSGFSPDEYFPNGGSGNGTGSLVGNDPQLGDIMELTYTYAGRQSMPLFYDNSTGSKISEAVRTLDPAKDTTDWSKYGLTTFILWFKGDAANGAAPVYVKINNTKKVYGVAAATTIPYWKAFQIDLSTIPAADLKNVQTITIGVGDGSAAGSGTILVDEIRLYATAPAIPVPTDPGTTGLVAYYAMNGDVLDGSGGGNNGTLVGEPSFADSMAGFGKALALDGVNDCVDLGNKAAFNPTGSFSVSLWANIGAWGTAWNHTMIGNRGESGVGWQIRRHSGTGLCFTTRGVDNDDQASTMTPPLNKWMNIVCVYDNVANTKTIYIDARRDGVVTTTPGAQIAATTVNTFIGARAAAGNTPEAFFTGMLDEIRVFNRALTAGEAAYLAGDR